MDNKKRRIAQIFRKPNDYFFSIEKVFSSISEFYQFISISVFKANASGVSLGNLRQFRKIRQDFDVFHVTGDIHYAVFAFPRSKVILTIHDCNFLKNYSGLKGWVLKKILLDWPVRYAHLVTTISEKSKAEIVVHSGCNPGKIVVIPNPVQDKFRAQTKAFNSACPRLLFMGKTPNKNLGRVIEAITGVSCFLHIIGVPTGEHIRSLQEKQIEYIVESSLTDDEIAERYQICDVLLFPSVYEGFGLPIIEAFQTGRVVITSNISPMREVADGGAYLVDPFDINSIRDGLLEVINDESLRTKLIARGFKVVERFQPINIASKYEQIYSQL